LSAPEIRFDGQVALVTGAGRGLGRAYATLLAARGASVVVHDAGLTIDGSGADRSVADAVTEEIIRQGGVATASYELLGPRAACEAVIAAALDRFGRLDVLVHNAGLVARAEIDQTDDQTWRRLLAVHVEAPFWLAAAAFPTMRRQQYGRIVLTISGVAMTADPFSADLAAYAMGKGAQFGLMNALAGAGEGHGIRVNAISPVAATRVYSRPVEPEELLPEQVAPAVAFLASRACAVSGAVVTAAGGRFGVGRYEVGERVEASSPEEIAALFDFRAKHAEADR
jgi:NAD(P)-dependent dehydrogenase (short-subunit alcohol dehydrogenase family)